MSQDTVQRDRPWLMRTYSGHSSARASNELYRTNLSKGQTGLSVAFDLPTQTGYDSDHPLARGEVGKVGVPIDHIGDMEALFEHIPLGQMNTSMTINATAPWLLALYVAVAERQGVDPSQLQGTTQNDVLKEYLSRGTYIFPPEPSVRLTTDLIAYTVENIPKWNPTNICSYHLQEAGATPTQELAYALSTAIAILDAVQRSGQVAPERFPDVVGRISFFVNAGIRFVEETCKLRAFDRMWDEPRAGALWCGRPQAAALSLRCAGQFPGPDRIPAGEQRTAHRAGNAGRDAVEKCPGQGHPVARLERGAGPAAPLGPAMGTAHAAGTGTGNRSAGVRRPA